MASLDNTITVTVNLDMRINDQPISYTLAKPAMMEALPDERGLVVHLHLDAMEFARVLYPTILELMAEEKTSHG